MVRTRQNTASRPSALRQNIRTVERHFKARISKNKKKRMKLRKATITDLFDVSGKPRTNRLIFKHSQWHPGKPRIVDIDQNDTPDRYRADIKAGLIYCTQVWHRINEKSWSVDIALLKEQSRTDERIDPWGNLLQNSDIKKIDDELCELEVDGIKLIIRIKPAEQKEKQARLF